MRVETTRGARAVQLQHAAGFHSSDTDLMAQLVPLVTAGLELGEPVAVALRPSTEERLFAALGSPAGLILLTQPDGPDATSGQTVAARRARELRELTSTTGLPVTVVSEHSSRFDGADGAYWTELDAASNIALADLPVSLTCFFPELPLHQEILDGARRNHPLLLVDGRRHHNPDHLGPHDVLTARSARAPVLLGPPDVRVTFTAWQLQDVRATVGSAVRAAGYELEHAEDVVLAVNEIATNAVEHGAAEAELAVWVSWDALICEIHDTGVLQDPLPGLRAPHPSEPRGRGVWIARQLCDSVHVWSDGHGTHVRMRASP